MNRRGLLKSFAAAGVVLSVPKAVTPAMAPAMAVEKLPNSVPRYPEDVIVSDPIATLVENADEIMLDLNAMRVISVDAHMDNNVREVYSRGSLNPEAITMGRCERTVDVQCYVTEELRSLFNELLNHNKLRVIYRQGKNPMAKVTEADPIMIDSRAVLESMEMQVSSQVCDVEAHLHLRLIT